MIARTPPGVHVELGLSSRPENVGVVRAMLSGVLDSLGQPAETADAVLTAASEACNNVVMHAYPGSEGPMHVDVTVHRPALEVVVRDHGTGILPHVEFSDDAVHGVGLAVVQAFTDRTELTGAAGRGTQVRMEFALRGEPAPRGGPFDVRAPRFEELDRHLTASDATLLSLAPTPLAGPVLARVAAALATRARFTVDRLSDAQLISDALAANAEAAMADGRVVVRLRPAHHTLDLEVGPLKAGAGAGLIADSGPGGLQSVLERLTADVRVRTGPAGEVLLVRIADRRRAPADS